VTVPEGSAIAYAIVSRRSKRRNGHPWQPGLDRSAPTAFAFA
jgi:hypothetical protein